MRYANDNTVGNLTAELAVAAGGLIGLERRFTDGRIPPYFGMLVLRS